MQPYWFPYIGYFQLAAHVDTFVIYDRIQYTKRGWINRNRILSNGEPQTITIPLSRTRDDSCVSEKRIADEFPVARRRILNKLRNSYRRAPYFASTMELMESTLEAEPGDPFLEFVIHSLTETARHIGFDESRLIRSSQIEEGETVASGQNRVIEICQVAGAANYVNPIGGAALYNAVTFRERKLTLKFLKPETPEYRQVGVTKFVPRLSILDVLMNLGPDHTHRMALQGNVLPDVSGGHHDDAS